MSSEGPVTAGNATDEMIARIRDRGYFVTKNPNPYDHHDMVKPLGKILAGSMKLAAYVVRDPETDEWSKPQFHMTMNNTVVAVMGQEAAKLFSRFVGQTLDRADPPLDPSIELDSLTPEEDAARLASFLATKHGQHARRVLMLAMDELAKAALPAKVAA